MRVTTLLNKLLNLQGLWVTGFRFEDDEMTLSIRPRAERVTCPHCGKSRSSKQEIAGKVRRWRHLGVWSHRVFIEAPIRRFRCKPCDRVVTEAVPWARHDSDFTRPFDCLLYTSPSPRDS